MTEEILGNIPTEGKRWNLVVTTERLVASQVVGRAQSDVLFVVGEGTWEAGTPIEVERSKDKSEEQKKMTAERILRANKKNYAINLSEIQHASVKKPGLISDATLKIETAKKNYKFTLVDRKSYKEHFDLLSSVLKSKLK